MVTSNEVVRFLHFFCIALLPKVDRKFLASEDGYPITRMKQLRFNKCPQRTLMHLLKKYIEFAFDVLIHLFKNYTEFAPNTDISNSRL